MQKKHLNRFTKAIAAAVLSAGIFAGALPAQAASVRDLSKASSYAREAVQWMAGNGVISGDQYGYFNPAKKISRAELVTIIVKALNLDTSNLPKTPTFSDVPASHWAYKYVEAATREGIVSGTGNGKFGANSMSTREQVTVMLLNSLSLSGEAVLSGQGIEGLSVFSDEASMSDWAKASIQFAISNNIMSGTGSNTFSPAGKATKEQIAVILYNFLKNSEKINQSASLIRKPIIIFNGDILKLTEDPVVQNGEILAPAQAFVKMGAVVTVDEAKTGVVVKNITEDKNIYFSIGSSTAYVNYLGGGNPFTDPEAAGNAVTMAVTPVISGAEVLLPVKEVVSAMGMSLDRNTKTNLLSVKDNLSAANPALYNALKNMLDFKGEYKTTMSLTMTDTINREEIMGLEYTMEGANNGSDSTSLTKLKAYDPIYGEQKEEYQVVKIGRQLYSKDMETGVWSKITVEDALEQGIMYYDQEADKAETQKLLDSYGKMKITFAGTTVLNGEEVTKYQIKAGKEFMYDLVPSDLLGGLSLEELYNKGINMKIEAYVNNKGHLVKQTVKLTAGMEQDGFGLELVLTATAEFSKTGENINIANPME
ncbi:endo-1,4-beta-xylanase A precursor [Ruminiclostridium hungatei]|uniref:Endo-1,4-beta-xylanase A n=1 Tax=Ruminiclostridium hungatei TaxID=48256 RepID=A0A1V4SFH6_RUMHU|nr:S-layer homology domain-containing protein [Ruminiclostridium hungatei]OPX42639.1 endo-1,4-beta-xylanase A precursor [Ruminiclostridium hungatei]